MEALQLKFMKPVFTGVCRLGFITCRERNGLFSLFFFSHAETEALLRFSPFVFNLFPGT